MRSSTNVDFVQEWDASTGEPIAPPALIPAELSNALMTYRDYAWYLKPGAGLPSEPDDSRSTADLIERARLLSARTVDAAGGLRPVRFTELDELWFRVLASNPAELFGPGESALARRREVLNGQRQMGILMENQHSRAVLHLSRAIDGGDHDPDLYVRRGLALAVLGRWEEAEADLTRAIDGGKALDVWRRRGGAYLGWGEFEKAIGDLTRAIKTGTEPAQLQEAHLRRGQALACLERWESAKADFQKAVDLANPADLMNARTWCAMAQVGAGDREAYRQMCAAVLNEYEKSENAFELNIAVWLCVIGPGGVDDQVIPVTMAEQAVEKYPKFWTLRNTLGAALYRAGRFEQAIEQATASIAAYKQDFSSQKIDGHPIDWLFLAMSHDRLGHAAEARQWLEKTDRWLKQNPQDKPQRAEPGRIALQFDEQVVLKLLHREAHELIGANQ